MNDMLRRPSVLSVGAGRIGLAIIGMLCVSCAPGLGWSEETEQSPHPEKQEIQLSLEECLRRTLEGNLSLSSQALNIGIAEQGVISAQAPFDSQFGLDLLYERARSQEEATRNGRGRADLSWSKRVRTGQVFRVTHSESRFSREVDVPVSPFYDVDWTISAVQPLAKGAGRTANMAPVWISENQREKSVLLTAEFIMDLLRTAEGVYLDLLYAIRFLEVQESALKLAQELLVRNQSLLEQGKLPGRSVEILQAKSAVAAREEGIIIALNEIAKGEDAIRRLMNTPVQFEEDRPQLVPAHEPLIDLEVSTLGESLAFALGNRPRVEALKLNLDSARLELAAARNNRLPEIGLRADLGFSGSDEHYGSSFGELAEGHDYLWQVGVSVSIPWGNRAAKSRCETARLTYEQAKIAYNDFLEELKLDVINAHRDMERDIKRMASTKATVEQTVLQLEAEQERLDQGKSDSFRILQFQDDLIEAQIRHLAATIDFNRSYYNLLRVEGRAIRNDAFDLTDIADRILNQIHSFGRRSSVGGSLEG
jgi:outer membrane protein TolC